MDCSTCNLGITNDIYMTCSCDNKLYMLILSIT